MLLQFSSEAWPMPRWTRQVACGMHGKAAEQLRQLLQAIGRQNRCNLRCTLSTFRPSELLLWPLVLTVGRMVVANAVVSMHKFKAIQTACSMEMEGTNGSILTDFSSLLGMLSPPVDRSCGPCIVDANVRCSQNFQLSMSVL